MEQLYSEALGKFLADRFVVGTCPKCKYEVGARRGWVGASGAWGGGGCVGFGAQARRIAWDGGLGWSPSWMELCLDDAMAVLWLETLLADWRRLRRLAVRGLRGAPRGAT